MLHIPFSERAHVKISYYIKQLKQGFVKGLGSAQTPPPYPRRPDRSRLHRPHTTKCCVHHRGGGGDGDGMLRRGIARLLTVAAVAAAQIVRRPTFLLCGV